jgi:glycosyltransferase involved in cell wall biosynthesis
MLSVCLITYNHEKYIAAALDSILAQQTDFPVRVIIGEDGSTDNTRAICEEYCRKFPELFLLLPAEKNMGMMKNFIRTYKACAGDYIAFIEGDDFWTDTKKLQKQVDFLKVNESYSLSFHNVNMLFTRNQVNAEKPFHTSMEKDSFDTEDLMQQWFIPTCSVVCRVYADFDLPEWYVNCKSGDIPFLLLMSLKGKIKYLPEMMGVYRVHDTGVSATHNDYDKIIAMVYIYENFNIHTNFRFRKKIREASIFEIDYHYPVKQTIIVKEPAPQDSYMVRVVRKIEKLFSQTSPA